MRKKLIFLSLLPLISLANSAAMAKSQNKLSLNNKLGAKSTASKRISVKISSKLEISTISKQEIKFDKNQIANDIDFCAYSNDNLDYSISSDNENFAINWNNSVKGSSVAVDCDGQNNSKINLVQTNSNPDNQPITLTVSPT